ncbi:ankyrin [Daldinia decipiens]|uniref:ankyrin n=1 Tax=Daldinia decipiens TaxID=326647 RepID=UPI0020C1EFE5|nr:ankyrin [Daldinia decipiens]KAI1652610.1 ankyrin [Daldinia decipiens]
MGIFEDTRDGKLDQYKLDQYKTSSFDIDSIDPETGLTLLATASLKGHTDVVKLLLQNNASATKLSQGDRTPVWFAAMGSMKKKDRAEIIRLLHAHGADINKPSSGDANYTPLMKVVAEWKDVNTVRQLINLGADKTLKNSNRETAARIAFEKKKDAMIDALNSSSQGRPTLMDIIWKIIAFILHLIVWLYIVTSSVLKGIIESSQESSEIKILSHSNEAQESNIAEEYKSEIINFILKNRMDGFFKNDDPFLDTLVEKAAKMKANPPESTLKSDKDIRDLIKVSLYQQVILCDDSISMSIGNRISAQQHLAKRITKFATFIIPDEDGVELRFTNSSVSGSRLREAEVETVMTNMQPTGDTDIGTNLIAKILKPLVYDKLDNKQLKRPLLVSIITDGCHESETLDTLRNAIIGCGKRLIEAGYEIEAVLFQVSRIGNSKASKKFFDGLRNDKQLKRVLYCSSDRSDKESEDFKQDEDQLEQWVYVTIVPPDELSVVV